MSWEAWGTPPDSEPQYCPLCGGQQHVEGCELGAEVARRSKAEFELMLRRKSGSAVDRFHNLCEGIARDADGSEWSREEWQRLDSDMLAQKKRIAELEAVLREARKIVRASSSRNLVKDWDNRVTLLLGKGEL